MIQEQIEKIFDDAINAAYKLYFNDDKELSYENRRSYAKAVEAAWDQFDRRINSNKS